MAVGLISYESCHLASRTLNKVEKSGRAFNKHDLTEEPEETSKDMPTWCIYKKL